MTRRPTWVAMAGLTLLLAACGSSHAATSTGGAPATMSTTTTAYTGPGTTAPGRPAPVTTTSTTTTSPPTTTTTAPSMRAVRWADVRVPGAVCDGSGSIQLHDFKAQIAAPPALRAGTADAVVLAGPVSYGNLLGRTQDAAALYVWCDNTVGTADGQRQSSWVIFVPGRSGPRAVGVLTPQQPDATQAPHAPYFDGNDGNLVMTPGRIVVHELWYASSDGTCCPSIRATSVWHYAGGHLQHSSTTT